jgi:DNA-binding beta-propeller fold protein YncE
MCVTTYCKPGTTSAIDRDRKDVTRLSRDTTLNDYDLPVHEPPAGDTTVLNRAFVLPIGATRWIVSALTVVAAVFLRFIGLDRWPLTVAESNLALAAHNVVHGERSADHLFGAPFTVVWTALAFFIGWSADSVSRIAMAIAGLAVVALLLAYAGWLGQRTAIAIAVFAAVSPTLVAASRRVDGGALYVLLTLSLIGSVAMAQRHPSLAWPAMAGVSTTLLVATGPLGIPAALLAWLAVLLLLPSDTLPRRDAWLAGIAAGIGALILAATVFLTRPGSFTASLGENLSALWDLHLSTFGQRAWMPAFNLVLNEPLTLALALVAVVLAPQRELIRAAMIWFIAAFLLLSLLGDTGLPGYALVTLPLVVLAGIGGVHLLDRLPGAAFRRGPAWVYLGAVLLIFTAVVSLLGLFTGREGTDTLEWLSRFALVVIVGILPLSLTLTWVGQRVAGHRLILVLCAALVLLGVVTTRSAVLAASERPGMPGEPLAIGALGAEIPIVVDRLYRVSRDLTMGQRTSIDPTGGHGLRVAIDKNVEQPFAWYFRDFPNVTIFNPDTEAPPVDAELLIVDGARDAQSVAPGFGGQAYVFETAVPRIYNNPDWGDILTGIFRPSAWRDFTGFIINREPELPPVHRQFQVLASGDLAERLFTSVGPYGLNDRPGAGTAQGQLNRPRGIAVGPDNTTYVVDSRNGRINAYAPDGSFMLSFGSPGSAPGQLGRLATAGAGGASGITVDDTGNIYVADTWNHRIQVFAPDGTYLRGWGRFFDASDSPELSQTEPGSFYGPRGVAFANGLLYVTDTGNERVQVFTPEGQFVRMFGLPGSGEGELREPVGIAVGADGTVYVADSHNARIARFTAEGEWLVPWPAETWTGQQFFEPYITLGPDGTLYATTSTTGFILTISPDGAPGIPLASAELRQPFGIAVGAFGNELLVVDGALHAVVRIPMQSP